MNDLQNSNELLEDIFAPSIQRRATLLEAAVRSARRRRTVRKASRSAMMLLLLLLLALPFYVRRDVAVGRVDPIGHPLSAKTISAYQVVRSAPFLNKDLGSFAPIPHLTSTHLALSILLTRDFNPAAIEQITDDQLLAFFPGQTAALVRARGLTAELVLVPPNPESAE